MTPRRAAMIALLTLLLAGVAIDAVAHPPRIRERQPLEMFPRQVAGWSGQTAYFAPEIVAALNADDYLLRQYRDRTHGGLWLYVAYYSSQPPDARVHSPAVCLPGAGWYIAHTGLERIRIGDRTIMVNSNVIQKRDQEQVVLYWYQMHGQVVAKEMRAVALLAWTVLTQQRNDEALVRVNAPVVGSPAGTLQAEVAFVRAMFPLLDRFLPH